MDDSVNAVWMFCLTTGNGGLSGTKPLQYQRGGRKQSRRCAVARAWF